MEPSAVDAVTALRDEIRRAGEDIWCERWAALLSATGVAILYCLLLYSYHAPAHFLAAGAIGIYALLLPNAAWKRRRWLRRLRSDIAGLSEAGQREALAPAGVDESTDARRIRMELARNWGKRDAALVPAAPGDGRGDEVGSARRG